MTAIVVLSASGRPVARRVAAELTATLHGRMDDDSGSSPDVAGTLRALFRAGTPIIFVGAIGALVRILAPVIGAKETDPPVVVVAEDASAVIPILGGHHGANDLARRIGGILAAQPVITTASDLQFGVALDDPPPGWHLAAAQGYRRFMAQVLAGARIRLEDRVPWLDGSTLPLDDDGGLSIHATALRMAETPQRLVYHPEILAIGVGCVRNAAPAAVLALVRETLEEACLAPESVAVVASLDVKMDEPAVHGVGEALRRPVRFFTPGELEAETPRLANPSEAVFRLVGCHAVAEAAALACSGERGQLVVPKQRSAFATCAVARAPEIISSARAGRPRGRLAVVGTGPGAAEWRTPEVTRLIGEADDLVGYGPYLDLLGSLTAGKRRLAFRLGEERDRVVAALDLAASGRRVALVSSGDPGIYAMASLVFECLEQDGRPDWARVAVTVAPGLSALQACAARLGAPLGHDFCAISLSDLLTPWPVIERRLRAAAEADFVVALYNPASNRRRTQLVRAMEIFAAHRQPQTPIAVGRRLGRSGEQLQVGPIVAFDTSDVDMLSLVIVGSTTTRMHGGWVFTPRGYRAAGSDRRPERAPAS